jgi:hypothetical protein
MYIYFNAVWSLPYVHLLLPFHPLQRSQLFSNSLQPFRDLNVNIILRPTVSWQGCHGVRHPAGTRGPRSRPTTSQKIW